MAKRVQSSQGKARRIHPSTRTHVLVPGPQLILTPPDEVTELLIVRVVVVLDPEQH